MKIKLLRKINYLNEAFLLSSYICNFDDTKDSDLPINYKKIYISKNELDKENENIVLFLKSIRTEARNKLKHYEDTGIKLFFTNSNDSDISEILYFLIYSNLKQSVKDYTKGEFLEIIRSEYIDNISSLGFSISNNFTFEEVDNLAIFNETQRYMIYKLLNNIGSITSTLYEYLFELEQIIRDYEYLIINELDFYYNEVLSHNIEKYYDSSLESIIKNNDIDYIEYSIFIQLPTKYSFSADVCKEKLVGYVFFGLMPLILREKPASIEDRKDDMFNKFSLISDYTRFNIMVLLSERTMYGKEIAHKLSLSTGTISYHLSTLIKEGLVISKIRGKRIYYSINRGEVNKMSIFLHQMGESADEE